MLYQTSQRRAATSHTDCAEGTDTMKRQTPCSAAKLIIAIIIMHRNTYKCMTSGACSLHPNVSAFACSANMDCCHKDRQCHIQQRVSPMQEQAHRLVQLDAIIGMTLDPVPLKHLAHILHASQTLQRLLFHWLLPRILSQHRIARLRPPHSHR